MATMEKPTQRKKKKKQQITTTAENENDNPSPLLDLEFPTTTTKCNELLSHDCFVSAEFQQQQQEQQQDESTSANSSENNQETINKIESDKNATNEREEECKNEAAGGESTSEKQEEIIVGQKKEIEIVEPSAPLLSLNSYTVKAPRIEFLPIVTYPDLSEIKKQEAQTKIRLERPIQFSREKVKPFTDAQLREIYCCKEIDLVEQFELEFLTNALHENFTDDPLYNMILQYSILRSKLKVNTMDIKKNQEHFIQMEEQIWTIKNQSVEFSGVCGDNLTVRGSKSCQIAVLNEEHLNSICLNLSQLHELVCYSYTSNQVGAKVFKLKIEQLIREILSYPVFVQIQNGAQIILNSTISSNLIGCIQHLRRAISILFSFVRKHTPDKIFLEDIQDWLKKLIALYIRVGTKEDHWFLLLHILRCPSGVGSWATSFVQIPIPTIIAETNVFTCPEINHCIAVLYILLLPIKKRNEFLSTYFQVHKDISDPVKEDLWILVDSDGEEGSTSTGECVGLKESDLIALLNQVPFEMLFKSILNIQDANCTVQQDLISGNHLIKVIAFNSTLIGLLGDGLITYNSERYKQFAKRLGRLIRHSVQYISDFYELFTQNNLSKDPHLCERINIEFNTFILKACSYIYKARNLGTWQYFSTLPFAAMDLDTIWQLFYYLNVGFPNTFPPAHEDFQNCFYAPDFSEKFNSSISDILPEDLYYILQTFFEMALMRDRVRDWDLIKAICSHIFNIGFINQTTKDICYKTSRDLLVNLTTTYPDLMAILLEQVKQRFNEIENKTYLFKSLPLKIWQPSMESFEILSYWLLNYNFDTDENVLSRIIISRLNWGFDSDNNLFLERDIHVRMACLICDVAGKHAPETIGLSGISESVRQLSSTIDGQTTKEQFVMWCWNMISTLRIHLLDQHRETLQNLFQNPGGELRKIPDLKEIEIVFQGVTENRPLAIYLAILSSLWGHSVPLICQKGFPLLRLLLNDYRHDMVIRCIQLIIPLFLECPETLIKCESFQEILKILLSSDRTYLKMAKDLILPGAPGPVMELLVNMIQCSIIYYTQYGLQSPTSLINLWIQILTNIPNWQNINVAYIIDVILKVAYQFPNAWMDCKEYFRAYYRDCDEWKATKSSFKIFLGSTNTKSLPVPTSDAAWFSLILLELEYEQQELKTHLWPELLRQMSFPNEKTSLDTALKRTTGLVGCASFPASSLVLYKYATLLSTLDIQHPLFAIICQNFFSLYLARVPFTEEELRFQYSYGVADRFYEYNISLMKKIKIRLKNAEEFYLQEANKHVRDNASSYFYGNYSKLMKSFLLWLEETNINKMCKDQTITLPPQFNITKLIEIFNGNKQHWTEFLNYQEIRKEQRDAALKWQKICFRSENNSRNKNVINSRIESKRTPLERIKSHLKSYDNAMKPPDLFQEPVLFKALHPNDINNTTLNWLKSNVKILDEQSKQFYLTVKELNALRATYRDVVQTLYFNINFREKNFLKCSSFFSKSTCTRPAEIVIELKKPEKNQIAEGKIDTIKSRHNDVIDGLLTRDVDILVNAMLNIEHTVKYLTIFQRDIREGKLDITKITDVAIQFFFYIIKIMNENITAFPSTNELCINLLSELGIFIRCNQETQGVRILETALKRPELLKTLSELLVPSHTAPECFLTMYKFLIESHLRRCDKKVIFVLISKFDLKNWLHTARPKLAEINRLLKLVITGLENWNRPETSLLQDLFRRHLVHIFEHEFPEHYGEVLQIVLTGTSEQNLQPEVLMDLLNSHLIRSECEPLTIDTNQVKISEQIVKFATQQNLFNFKEITDTIILFARHFQTERLQHGLHGLYPKHKKYCVPLSMWFSCFSHTAIVSAIYTYPGVLADQICDWIFAPVNEMYSPWLITYTGQNVQQSTANWIRQLIANGRVLLPWSDLYIDTAQIMLQSFVKSLQFILESLPVSSSILGHVFSWYVFHFASNDVGNHIRSPVHTNLVLLPWERFNPMPTQIELFYRTLNEYLPECHSFLGHIFLRTNWSAWMKETFSSWNLSSQTHVISLCLTIFIQISFEPNVHDDKTITVRILKESLNYPWHLVEYQGIESIFNWIVSSVEPAIILKIPTECNEIDLTVLELMKIAAGMKSSPINGIQRNHSSIAQSKRILYTQTFIRLLRTCASKHQKLLDTKEGRHAFSYAIVDLLGTIEEVESSNNMKREHYEIEAQNMITEIITELTSQNETISKFFMEALMIWQSKCNTESPIICRMLNAIGLCKTFTNCMYTLLEVTIYNYFRCNGEAKNEYSSSWDSVLQKLGSSLEKLQLMNLLQGSHLLSLHCYICYKIRNISDLGEKITFLQDISQLLENIKTNEATEPRMAIIWGAIISCGCKILESSENVNAKKPLLMLARYLQVISTQCEGWGEGLLGVIGLKRDSVSNRRKILTRCLSCIIFSLFPDKSSGEPKPNQEFLLSLEDLKVAANSKKYSDVKLLAGQAIAIIEENHFPRSEQVANKIFNITRLLYNDSFLINLPEVWNYLDKCS